MASNNNNNNANNANNDPQMFGLPSYVLQCGLERTEELNDRVLNRNIPSQPLAPQFSMRPASTKYAIMPIVDNRVVPETPIIPRPIYNIEQVFNPGNAQAPWSGFSTNIDNESSLRNQFFAIQNCPQSEYIPSSNSDMYVNVAVGRQERQQFPMLFEEQSFSKFDPNTCNVGNDTFGNCTRQQMK